MKVTNYTGTVFEGAQAEEFLAAAGVVYEVRAQLLEQDLMLTRGEAGNRFACTSMHVYQMLLAEWDAIQADLARDCEILKAAHAEGR